MVFERAPKLAGLAEFRRQIAVVRRAATCGLANPRASTARDDIAPVRGSHACHKRRADRAPDGPREPALGTPQDSRGPDRGGSHPLPGVLRLRLEEPSGQDRRHQVLRSAGARTVKLPAQSPNLSAYAERFVRSIRKESRSRVIPLSERHLRRVVSGYAEHCPATAGARGTRSEPAPHGSGRSSRRSPGCRPRPPRPAHRSRCACSGSGSAWTGSPLPRDRRLP